MSLPRSNTKQRILDSAESLFAQQGLAATSLRAVIAAADVNSAAIHYHFGSKEALVEAVFERRIEPVNRERLARLQHLEASAGDSGVAMVELLEAFIHPLLKLGQELGDRGPVVVRLLGRLRSEEPDSLIALAQAHMREVHGRFSRAAAQSVEGLTQEEASERFEYVHAAVAWILTHLAHASEKPPEYVELQDRFQRMINFMEVGLQQPSRIRMENLRPNDNGAAR
ncbi:TetR/AcrR family transcriptional regulator [Myxococcota bacterium]|nr:TetR/AcrR family transcriptional regulator [Myxococcota bacterium]